MFMVMKISLTANTIGVDESAPLLINGYYPKANHGLSVVASDVFIEETAGDMQLYSIEANNVWLKTRDGDFIDAMLNEEVDQRSIDQLMALWNSMNLFGAEAVAKTNETIIAYEEGKAAEYHSYWETRLEQGCSPDDTGCTPTAILSAEERAIYASIGWDETAIDQYDQKLIAQYLALHEVYGVLGDNYVEDWQYSDDWLTYEPQFDSATINTNDFDDPVEDDDYDAYYKNTISIVGHAFVDGQVVVYDCDGGTPITGLTCGATYYVTVVDDDLIRLTDTYEDAVNQQNEKSS